MCIYIYDLHILTMKNGHPPGSRIFGSDVPRICAADISFSKNLPIVWGAPGLLKLSVTSKQAFQVSVDGISHTLWAHSKVSLSRNEARYPVNMSQERLETEEAQALCQSVCALACQ